MAEVIPPAAEQIVRAILTMHATAYYVATTPYQTERVVEAATKVVEPILDRIIRQAIAQVPANPT